MAVAWGRPGVAPVDSSGSPHSAPTVVFAKVRAARSIELNLTRRPMRYQRRLTTCNGDKGDVFFTPNEGGGEALGHIGEFAAGRRRPCGDRTRQA
jgi:hypothetical protein